MFLRSSCTILAFWVTTFSSLAFGHDLGTPKIKNYAETDYKAHGQTWSAVQDRRGVMYFANTLGILQFDGVYWDLIEIQNNAAVRSLTMGPNGTIFYAANAEFGYLASDANGKVRSVSLTGKIPEADRKFNYVWQTLSARDGIYFLTKEKIFHLKNGKITTIDGKFATSQALVINDNLLYIDADRGLCLIDDDTVIPLTQFAGVTNGSRVSLAQIDGHEIIGVRASGDFIKLNLSPLWDANKKRYHARPELQDALWQTIPSELSEFVKTERATAYRLYRINQKTFGLATLKSGIVVFDNEGKFIRNISKANGLIDNTVSHIYIDQTNNWWASTNTGISYIEYSRAQSTFGAVNGLDGVMISARKFNNKMYVGGFQQMLVQEPFQFSIDQTLPKFKPVKNGTGAAWFMLDVDGDLLAATAYGLAKIEGDAMIHIPKSPADGFCLATSKKWPQYVFMGGIGSTSIFKHEANNWVYVGQMKGVKENIRSITENENGDLWLNTETHGLLFAHFTGDSPLDVELTPYNSDHGLPNNVNLQTLNFNGNLVVSTQKGIYRFIGSSTNKVEPAKQFQPDPDFAPFFNSPPISINTSSSDGKGGFIAAADKTISWLTPSGKGGFEQKPSLFYGAPSSDVPLYVDTSGLIWVPHLGLTMLDPSAPKNYAQEFNVLIRSVTTRTNRSIFEGTYSSLDQSLNDPTIFEVMPKSANVIELPFKENGLTFNFSAAFFERIDTLQFRFNLDGFDENWSSWGKLTTKEYTNIAAGTYTFRVQARNIYGVEGKEANFTFHINAPWYLTVWAIALWLILGIGSILGGVRLYTRKLKREKQILEQLVEKRTQQLHEASLTDPLTGLRNRRFITEILQTDTSAFIKYKNHLLGSTNFRQNSSTDEVFGLYILDLDHFKQVNDTFGHDGGDRLLKQFGKILTSSVREDDVVIRLGGEEFLIVLKKTNMDYLSIFAKKLLDKVASTDFDLGNDVIIHKTCSIGYVSFPFDASQPTVTSFEQVINLADMAMYYAKNNGRNRAIFVQPGTQWENGVGEVGKIFSSLEFGLDNQYLILKE